MGDSLPGLSSQQPSPSVSYSRCLEHDGQLFGIQLVPRPDNTTSSTRRAKQTKDNSTTVSAACELENRRLDFAEAEGDYTPLQRWFGLKQYVLLRTLGQSGTAGMSVDQLLSTTTMASGNCKCSIPVLVSSDWDGLDREGEGDDGLGEMENAVSCKGYSAPDNMGVACSVRFQTGWTEEVRGKGREGLDGGV